MDKKTIRATHIRQSEARDRHTDFNLGNFLNAALFAAAGLMDRVYIHDNADRMGSEIADAAKNGNRKAIDILGDWREYKKDHYIPRS